MYLIEELKEKEEALEIEQQKNIQKDQ